MLRTAGSGAVLAGAQPARPLSDRRAAGPSAALGSGARGAADGESYFGTSQPTAGRGLCPLSLPFIPTPRRPLAQSRDSRSLCSFARSPRLPGLELWAGIAAELPEIQSTGPACAGPPSSGRPRDLALGALYERGGQVEKGRARKRCAEAAWASCWK